METHSKITLIIVFSYFKRHCTSNKYLISFKRIAYKGAVLLFVPVPPATFVSICTTYVSLETVLDRHKFTGELSRLRNVFLL